MNLNIKSWKEFSFSDIFIIKKGFYNKKPEHIKDGNIPFLGATEKNNGITDYFSLEDIESASKTGDENNAPISEKIFPANALCVTNNGSVGFAFYQDKEFTCSHDVNPLYIKNGTFNRYTALFVSSVISKDRYRWAYGRKWRPERMIKSKIMLPSNEDGTPDWQFMEDYIKSLHSKFLTTKNKLSQNSYSINVDKWKRFKLNDLFNDIYKAVPHHETNLIVCDKEDKETLPYITRTEENNGCKCHVLNENFDDIEMGNAITIGDTTSTIFYQKDSFLTGDHMVILRADWLNLYTGLFIVTLLQQERFKYSYGRAFKKDIILETEILLPVKDKENKNNDVHQHSSKDYTPDWEFIENYIKSLPYGDKL